MSKEINKMDLKALQFRDELIRLCKKYNCSIFGISEDDGNGNMYLGVYDKKTGEEIYYIMKDHYNNYSLEIEDDEYKTEPLMDIVILNSFNRESGEMAGLNNIKVQCGVITNDSEKARLKFIELYCKYDRNEVKRFVLSQYEKCLELYNGKIYVWIKPNDRTRGYRCKQIIIDRNLTLKELNEIVIPMCCACGRDDVEIF